MLHTSLYLYKKHKIIRDRINKYVKDVHAENYKNLLKNHLNKCRGIQSEELIMQLKDDNNIKET